MFLPVQVCAVKYNLFDAGNNTNTLSRLDGQPCYVVLSGLTVVHNTVLGLGSLTHKHFTSPRMSVWVGSVVDNTIVVNLGRLHGLGTYLPSVI